MPLSTQHWRDHEYAYSWSDPKSIDITTIPAFLMAYSKHLMILNPVRSDSCTHHACTPQLYVALGCFKDPNVNVHWLQSLYIRTWYDPILHTFAPFIILFLHRFWHIYSSSNCTLVLHNPCSVHSWWMIHFVDLQGQRWRWRLLDSCHNMLGIRWPWPWGYLRCSVLQHSFWRRSWRKSFPGGARSTLRFNWSHKSNGLCRLSERVWRYGGKEAIPSSMITLPGYSLWVHSSINPQITTWLGLCYTAHY